MSRTISIVDETLRDAHQCLWMTRMTNEMMLPFAERLDRIGFSAIDLIGGAVWDVAVRFLREDPWERIRHVRSQVEKTPINAWIRGQSLWTFEIFPDDVVELAIERLAANGVRWMSLYDQFNDLQNVAVCVRKGNAEGLNVLGALVFSESPVHTDAYFATKAAEFVALGADEIIIKDPSGMISVERARTLVPAIRTAIGAVPINMHTHCMSGRAPDVLIESADLGVDRLHTAISPLAHGASHSRGLSWGTAKCRSSSSCARSDADSPKDSIGASFRSFSLSITCLRLSTLATYFSCSDCQFDIARSQLCLALHVVVTKAVPKNNPHGTETRRPNTRLSRLTPSLTAM